MSQFVYNTIAFSYIKTNSVQRVARFSPDMTEYMWTDFTLDLNCIYGPSATSYPTQGLLPEITDVAIRSILMQPRQPLYYAEGGIAIIDISGIDCENGPIPIECNITRIAGSSLIYIRYVIKTSIFEACPDDVVIPSAIASSRYSRSESIDAQYRSTVVTNGKAFFYSNVLEALAINADSYRAYLIPRPFLNYTRKQLFVNLEPNGIYMEFTAIDEQQFIDLGDNNTPGTAGSTGITQMDLTYSTNLNPSGAMGAAGYTAAATVEARALGRSDANTWNMMQFIYVAAMNKFGNIAQQGFTTGATAVENIFRNEVAISITFFYVPMQANIVPNMAMALNGFIGQPIAALPQDDGINPQPPYGNATRGTIPIELAASAFATACFNDPENVGVDDTGALPSDTNLNTGLQQTFPQVQIFFNPNVQPNQIYVQQSLSQARSPNGNSQNGYINYSIKSEYDTDYGTIQVPSATNPNNNYVPGGGSGGSSSGSTNTASCTNIQLFQVLTKKKISWVIERVGAVPEVPSPTVTSSLSSNYTLLRAVKTPIGMEVMPDGYTPIYRISGVYTYSLLNPVMDTDAIAFDIPAWVAYPQSTYTQLISSDFEDGIINNSVQSG